MQKLNQRREPTPGKVRNTHTHSCFFTISATCLFQHAFFYSSFSTLWSGLFIESVYLCVSCGFARQLFLSWPLFMLYSARELYPRIYAATKQANNKFWVSECVCNSLSYQWVASVDMCLLVMIVLEWLWKQIRQVSLLLIQGCAVLLQHV